MSIRSMYKNGFTLLELLTVMGMLALITTLAAVSYYNMTRSSSYVALERNVQNLVTLARQQAALQNRPVYLLRSFYIDDGSNTEIYEFTLAFKGGTVTLKGNNTIYNMFAEPPKETLSSSASGTKKWDSDLYLYNMSTGRRQRVDEINTTAQQVYMPDTPYTKDNSGRVATYMVDVLMYKLYNPPGQSTVTWNVGDTYGYPLHQSFRLPNGFKFPNVNANEAKIIEFSPTGMIYEDGNAKTSVTFDIKEIVKANPVRVVINQGGSVNVAYPEK